ncbi:threonine--tRNA ligase [Promicromonospora sp. MEB111]|uniref:threonine--tRNA ligase n=1 Tax=Promicromonospora sp. MEB111 TaxID=3040301 RepID=UPI002549DDD8|nr:threonine--tRNA ligase [Promicromonospora sp. MEB111]
MNAPAPNQRSQAPAVLDHRALGRDMRIFDTSPLVGPGLPLWLPAGAAIRYELEQYAREVALRTGCEPVYSPVLGKRSLYERSGHWAKFADDMFPPMYLGGNADSSGSAPDLDGSPDADADPLVLRPANCPHHAQIYASEPRSYRDLPVRYSELASMFRAERSGVLSGLSRVRQINLDDAHVFCRPDQVGAEVRTALAAVLEVLDTLGIEVAYLRLSGRDASERWLGAPERWAAAEEALRAVLDDVASPAGLPWHAEAGEAAFYGPKIDVQVLDARGHEETLATVQLDFNQPERFDLTYVAASGERERVVMIHRGTVGAMERMVAFLLERHGGRLPFWLAPVQVCLLPLPDAPDQLVDDLAADLRARGLRVRVEREGSLGSRIRKARQRRDALLGVLGAREVAAGALAVTDPASGARASVPLAELGDRLAEAARRRVPRVSL